MGPESIIYMLTVIVAAGLAILWMAMNGRMRVREMEHRERMAMIERGLIPPPEMDPGAFERRTGLATPAASQAAVRSRSLGVILIGIGLGLTVLISFAGDAPETGTGIGGAFALLGIAFYVNGALSSRRVLYQMPSPSSPGRPPDERPTSTSDTVS